MYFSPFILSLYTLTMLYVIDMMPKSKWSRLMIYMHYGNIILEQQNSSSPYTASSVWF